jgi:CSLREA domain-containing protein
MLDSGPAEGNLTVVGRISHRGFGGRVRATRVAALAVALAAVALIVAGPAAAATITPNTLSDEYNADASTCSLREAVQASNLDMPFDGCVAGSGADVIPLGNGTYQLQIADSGMGNADGELEVTSGDTLTISHAGSGRTAIDGGDLDRVIYNFGTLTITGLAIQNGLVTNQNAGGIASQGALELANVTVSGNQINTAGYGGGIWAFSGSAILTNVTVSGNVTAPGGAGAAGIYVGETANLTNVTVANNNAGGGSGGGLYVFGAANLKNTIIAGNSAPTGPDCFGSVTSLDHNLIGSTTGCAFVPATADQTNVPAGLAPLADNGGPASTHALAPGGNAVDKVPPASCTGQSADQRGYPRPAPAGGNCDIGAYELFACGGTPLNTAGAFPGACPPVPPAAVPPANKKCKKGQKLKKGKCVKKGKKKKKK